MKLHEPSVTTRKATLGRLELRCPPLPQTLVEATNLIDDPQRLEVGPVTEMVQRDPIVVAKLLHIVNSAYYGLRSAINSVERAVVMLGPVAVAGIVVGMNMLKLNYILDGPASRCFSRLISHSIATAFLARHLLEGTPGQGRRAPRLARVGVTFTAGLLHDFGKITLVYNYPHEAHELYEERSFDDKIAEPDTRRLEQLLFGCDHTEAGEYVARKLGFPEQLIDVIRFHHEPEHTSDNPESDRLVRATAAASLAAKAMGYDLQGPRTWDEIAVDPVWGLLLEHDLHYVEDVEYLFEDLRAQQEHLNAYVQGMMTSRQADTRRANMR